MVMVATGGWTSEEAHRVLGDIHLRTELTWNKQMPLEFHTEVKKTASLLVNIAVLSGVLGLAAVLLGLFLGFGRAWIRVLMGKPAATEPEFLRLDLRGGEDRGRRVRDEEVRSSRLHRRRRLISWKWLFLRYLRAK